MTIEKSIEEARTLSEILMQLRKITLHMPKFQESEVRLRAETINNMICILQNDTFHMRQQWIDETCKVSKV